MPVHIRVDLSSYPVDGGGGGGGGDVDRQFYSGSITSVGLSAKAIIGQTAALFGVYSAADTLLAGFEVDGDLFAPNVISRYGEVGEFDLNTLYDDYETIGAQKIQSRDVAASAPTNGQALAWNTSASQWEPQTISGGGGGSSPVTTEGDLIVGDNTGSEDRLPIGASSTVLTSNGTTASWQAANSNATTLQSRTLAATAPTDGQAIVWNNGTSQWEPQDQLDTTDTNATQLQSIDVDNAVPTNGEVLTYNSTLGQWEAQPAAGGGGGGDVTGPASAADNAIVRFDGTTGKIIQYHSGTTSIPTISDAGLAEFPSSFGNTTVQIGASTTVSSTNSVSIGNSCQSASKSVAVGQSARATGSGEGVAVGARARCGRQAVVIGSETLYEATSFFVGIGYSVDVNSYSVAIGHNASGTGDSSVAIGRNTVASTTNAFAIGATSTCSGTNAQALGNNSSATGDNSLAIGPFASDGGFDSSIALGRSSSATANNQIVIGGSSYHVNTAILGRGDLFNLGTSVVAVATGDITLRNTQNTGTNGPGPQFTIQAGGSSGLGEGGSFVVKTAPAGTVSNNVANTHADRFEIRGNGEVIQHANDAATADGDLWNNSISFYLDEAGDTLTVKAKYSTGTVKTGTIALA